MLAGCGRAGDFAGNPLRTVDPDAQNVYWLDLTETTIRGIFAAPAGLPAHKWITYLNGGVEGTDVSSPQDFTAPVPGTIPNLAAVAVPDAVYDAGYDPLGGASLANLVTLLERLFASARGKYRIFNGAEFRFYRSNSAPPEPGDVPFATSATLPHQPAVSFADGTWYLSVSYFNGVLDSGFLPLGRNGETYLTLEVDGGEDIGNGPNVPSDVRLIQRAGGVIRVSAFYVATADGSNRANRWAIAYTVDGSTPAVDTPDEVVEMSNGPMQILSFDLPAQAHGTTVKVRVQTRRTTGTEMSPVHRYSAAGSVVSASADASGPSVPLDLRSWSGALPEEL